MEKISSPKWIGLLVFLNFKEVLGALGEYFDAFDDSVLRLHDF
jgi:hypothetical protein